MSTVSSPSTQRQQCSESYGTQEQNFLVIVMSRAETALLLPLPEVAGCGVTCHWFSKYHLEIRRRLPFLRLSFICSASASCQVPYEVPGLHRENRHSLCSQGAMSKREE